jgi:acyl-CoA synthetase (NDP forming)
MTDLNGLEKFFRPRSVAIVGASPQPGTARNTLVKVLLKHRFAGSVYPVSPSHAEIEGLKAYKSIADLPEAPDVALVITPARTVPGIVAECGAKGIRRVIIYSSGFEETADGKAIAVALREAAEQHDVAILGPNGQGVWSVRGNCMLSFSNALLNLDSIRHAPIAVISHSGALAGAMATTLQKSGMGCSYVVSVGNETCLDALDFLAWVVEQDDVRVVAMYIEALKDGGRIVQIAERARTRGVQIVALKAGRSAVGQQATASHTGKMASAHDVYADVFEQAGIISVSGLSAALVAIEVLTYANSPRDSGDPKGGVSVLSSSGGAGALLADHSSEFGIPLAEFSQQTVDTLTKNLPAFARKENPVDITGQIYSDPNLFRDTCLALESDPRTEAIIVQFASSGPKNLLDNMTVFKSVGSRLPLLTSFVGPFTDDAIRKELRDAGVLICADPEAAMTALSLLYQRRRFAALPHARPRATLAARPAPSTWADMMAMCEESGITPAKWTLLGADDRAADACASMKFPVVVKALPSDADHKTELGLVRLRLRSFEEIDACAKEFRMRLGKAQSRMLVQEMIEGGVEVLVSCLRQTDFGPIISIGTGGEAVELYRDVVHLALPVSPEQIVGAIRKLRLWKLMSGFRGRPAADVETLARGAAKFGDLFLALPDVNEFEINPVIVKPKGIYAVDALVATVATEKAS